MCGIAGALSGANEKDRILPLVEAQKHRGPDAWGVWADEVCALGHRRLAIIDLSEAGRQPLSNDDGSVRITFNGEIYNFQALRAELEQLGYRFRTRTDTEVIVHAWEQWGTDCVKRLRGMFAFGLWDRRRRRLFLARDRVGKKPLFYTQVGERFLFASELQGLLADADVPREVNLAAIDAYLSWGYIPAPLTGFKGISKLPPAHWMTVDWTPDGPVARVERYWKLEYEPKLQISEEEAVETLREKLTEAVRLRMISDVPLGAFLSGGIDSSIVVGLMAKLSDRPVKTFSIGFREAAYNETEHARRVARLWATDHQEFIVEPDALAILPRLVRHYGEPYADSSAIPTFYVSQLTRANVTVALNGDGGDESFAGYERYLANRIAERVRSIPGSAWSAKALGGLLPDSLGPKNRLRRVKRFLSVAAQPMAERYEAWVGTSNGNFSERAKRNLYREELSELFDRERPGEWMESLFAGTGGLDPVDAAMAVDVQSYLPFDLLVKVDITSMANSLEARSPFLDHEVMEFAARLPVSLKLRGKEAKYLLKRAFPDLLPPENVNRPKMGFGVPVGQWFRGPLRELLCDSLIAQDSRVREYFRAEEVERLVSQHLKSQTDHSFRLWNLLMLELWQREFVAAGSAGEGAVPQAVALAS
ncbi:MAG TPA: asparagine synthase (glutamine-hydrolyzing) [Blastocatellia bacterium]|nr:asparagine synthase (glutamine-hydrolyzing) [Blastocatellia bacterium]